MHITTTTIPTYNTLTENEAMEVWAMLSLQCTPSINNITIKRLLLYYSTAQQAIEELAITPYAWEALGIRRDTINSYLKHTWKAKADYIWSTFEQSPHMSLLLYSSPAYPIVLRAIADPPPILYCLGNTSLLTTPAIAVIGTRKSSSMGNSLSYTLSHGLSVFGLTVISGLAEGIDTQAHQASLDTSGSTIAVLGHGIDTIYPAKNKNLAKKIIEKGCIVTEFHPNTPPKPAHFPIRNRIVSGLSLGVLVIEATIHSGTLTTVRNALEQGKNIYVIPKDLVSEHSTGNTYLIEEGATVISTAQEIFEDILPQMTDAEISPTIRKKLLEYHLNLDIEERNHYTSFLESFPKNTTLTTMKVEKTKKDIKQKKQEKIAKKQEEIPLYQEKVYSITKTVIEYGLSTTAEKLLTCIHQEELSIEDLVKKTQCTASEISSELIMLEIQGLIQKKAGGYYGIFYE